jgi:hypothetical protein
MAMDVRKHLRFTLVSLALVAFGLALAARAGARGLLEDLTWENFNGPGGPAVEFRLTFINPDAAPSEPLEGTVNAQDFGAFLPDGILICEFSVPPLAQNETHVVVCQIELADLPPVPPRQDEAGNFLVVPGGPPPPPGVPGTLVFDCPVTDFWAGGVDVIWTGDGGGQVIVHRGMLPVCSVPGSVSYIRLDMDCNQGGGVGWSFSDVCAGWTANLVNEFFFQAPNPLPSGPWTGWIEVTSTQPLGAVCDFDLDLACGAGTAEINVTGQICDCDRAVPLEATSWGRIKNQYR